MPYYRGSALGHIATEVERLAVRHNEFVETYDLHSKVKSDINVEESFNGAALFSEWGHLRNRSEQVAHSLREIREFSSQFTEVEVVEITHSVITQQQTNSQSTTSTTQRSEREIVQHQETRHRSESGGGAGGEHRSFGVKMDVGLRIDTKRSPVSQTRYD
jgi:hypothetical protein